ncbi:MAG: TIGR00730 family Rossman fold protein [Tannerellaceae bacterium]|jgi:uncharacterized protein (TIGR00730 family)|nr:TIGR00730 family Rossman fold protein [Tannerellaceae bacterium]
MKPIKRIAVYCGASPGAEKIYAEQAFLLGAMLADRKTGIVTGGGKVGLMNCVTNGALEHGGSVTGVLPKFLNTESLAHEHLTKKIIVRTMHERKQRMYELSDAAIALPGGYGTMDELFEMLAWAQLGLHEKPIGLLNINGFYDQLLHFLMRMNSEQFLQERHRHLLIVHNNVAELLSLILNY